jgi:hypothetical protein
MNKGHKKTSTFHLQPFTYYLPPSTFYLPPSTFFTLPADQPQAEKPQQDFIDHHRGVSLKNIINDPAANDGRHATDNKNAELSSHRHEAPLLNVRWISKKFTVSEIEALRKQAVCVECVKNCKLFEALALKFCNFAFNANRASKTHEANSLDFLHPINVIKG